MGYIKGIATFFPEKTITNEQISEKFPEWNSQKILDKIGVQKRFISNENQFTSDLATQALNKLISEYNIEKNDIDFLIVCTQTPDYILPTTACLVQQKSQLPTHCAAIDINQGCSGYVYGLSLANGLIASGNFKNVVLITADTYSKYIHPTDKGNISIFGDGATATLISNNGYLKIGQFTLGSDGSGAENLIIKNSGTHLTKNQMFGENPDDYLYMNGSKIFNFVVKYIPPVILKNLEDNQKTLEDIDLFVFHQANTFMLEKVRQEIGIPSEKFVIEMLDYGNTVSSTIPIALKEHFSKFPEKPKKYIQLAGFGVGYSWGAVCLEFVN